MIVDPYLGFVFCLVMRKIKTNSLISSLFPEAPLRELRKRHEEPFNAKLDRMARCIRVRSGVFHSLAAMWPLIGLCLVQLQCDENDVTSGALEQQMVAAGRAGHRSLVTPTVTGSAWGTGERATVHCAVCCRLVVLVHTNTLAYSRIVMHFVKNRKLNAFVRKGLTYYSHQLDFPQNK